MEIARVSGFARIRRLVHTSSRWLETVGCLALLAIVLAAIVDVIGSKLFQWPLPGSTEIIGMAQLLAISAGLAFSKINGNQISVTFIKDRLPPRYKAAFNIYISIFSLGLFVIVGWMTYLYALNLHDSGTGTFLLEIPYFPMAFLIAFCCIPICAVILLELVNAIERIIK